MLTQWPILTPYAARVTWQMEDVVGRQKFCDKIGQYLLFVCRGL